MTTIEKLIHCAAILIEAVVGLLALLIIFFCITGIGALIGG